MSNTASMVAKVASYLAYRRSLGYVLRSEGKELLSFGRYADRIGHRGPLTLALALEWARLPTKVDPTYWARRLGIVRGLARHLQFEEPETEVPPFRMLGPSSRRKVPHIYSTTEIIQLLTKARRLSQGKGLQPLTIYTVIGLMACTGMRISEVLRLRVEDVDLKKRILTVRESKFHKSRLLPLHATVAARLAQYDKERHRHFPCAQSFFVGRRGGPLAYGNTQYIFQGLVKDIPNRGDHPRPRFHDLRHTFACRILTRWSKHPVIFDRRILWLMHYLGHTDVSYTYWYLSATPELLSRAAAHFENHLKRSTR